MCCKMTWFAQILLAVGGAIALGAVYSLPADETDPKAKAVKADEVKGEQPAKDPAKAPAKPDNSGLKKITKDHDVYLDLKRPAVVIDGEVCLREGQLEMSSMRSLMTSTPTTVRPALANSTASGSPT